MNLRPDLAPDLQQSFTDALKAVAKIEKKYNINFNQHKKQSVSSALLSAPNNNNDEYECIEGEDTENDGTSLPYNHNSNNHLSKSHAPSTSFTSINNYNNKNRKKGIVYCIEWCYKCIIHKNLTIFHRICWLPIRFGFSMVHNT